MLLSCDVRGTREKLQLTVHMEIGKRNRPYVKAANDDGLISRCIFVLDRNTRISYLMDTGADISVYPRSKMQGPAK